MPYPSAAMEIFSMIRRAGKQRASTHAGRDLEAKVSCYIRGEKPLPWGSVAIRDIPVDQPLKTVLRMLRAADVMDEE